MSSGIYIPLTFDKRGRCGLLLPCQRLYLELTYSQTGVSGYRVNSPPKAGVYSQQEHSRKLITVFSQECTQGSCQERSKVKARRRFSEMEEASSLHWRLQWKSPVTETCIVSNTQRAIKCWDSKLVLRGWKRQSFFIMILPTRFKESLAAKWTPEFCQGLLVTPFEGKVVTPQSGHWVKLLTFPSREHHLGCESFFWHERAEAHTLNTHPLPSDKF